MVLTVYETEIIVCVLENTDILTDVIVDMTIRKGIVLNTNRPSARSCHLVQNQTRWDASCTVGLPKQSNSYQSTLTCLSDVPLYNVCLSICDFVPCDRIVPIDSEHLKRSWNVVTGEMLSSYGWNIKGRIGFQRPPNFWLAKALMSPCILCKIQKPNMLIFEARSMTEALMPMIRKWETRILDFGLVDRFARSFT